MKQRFEILNEALRIRSESKQILIDCEYWNERVRKADEKRIEADPEGQLGRIIALIEAGLTKELLCVHVSGPDEIFAVRSLKIGDEFAAQLNAEFAKFPQRETGIEMVASVQAWPYDAEDHAQHVVRCEAEDERLRRFAEK